MRTPRDEVVRDADHTTDVPNWIPSWANSKGLYPPMPYDEIRRNEDLTPAVRRIDEI